MHSQGKGALKTYTHTVSPEQKMLKSVLYCGCCGERLSRRTKAKKQSKERWHCKNDIQHISQSLTDDMLMADFLECVGNIKIDTQNSPVKISLTTEMLKLANEMDSIIGSASLNKDEMECHLLDFTERLYAQASEKSTVDIILNVALTNYIKQNNIKGILQIVESIEILHMQVHIIKFKTGTIYVKGEPHNE